jgi:hypothetical protein
MQAMLRACAQRAQSLYVVSRHPEESRLGRRGIWASSLTPHYLFRVTITLGSAQGPRGPRRVPFGLNPIRTCPCQAKDRIRSSWHTTEREMQASKFEFGPDSYRDLDLFEICDLVLGIFFPIRSSLRMTEKKCQYILVYTNPCILSILTTNMQRCCVLARSEPSLSIS